MWARTRAAAVGVVALALALSGCSTAEVPPEPPPSGWGGAPAAELVPSGMLVAGAASSSAWTPGRVVADGASGVWVDGPWSVTRIDPTSGTGSSFGVEDDSAFASSAVMVPSGGSGVWLVGRDRARLFDGQRFAADLPIPAEVVRADADEETSVVIADAAEVGSELWLSVTYIRTGADGQQSGRIVRWSAGEWSVMADRGDGIGGVLALDTDAGVWAAGIEGPIDGAMSAVSRWDGTGWTTPASDDPQGPDPGGVVAGDPTGGVWSLSRQGPAVVLSRFDGTGWDQVGTDVTELVGRELAGTGEGGERGLAVTPAGDAWVTGHDGAAQVSPGGSVLTFGPAQGVPAADDALLDVAVAGGDVLLRNGPDVRRLVGAQFEPLWLATTGEPHMQGLAAVSADELWNRVAVTTPAGGNRESRWARFRDGAWTAVGPRVTGMGSSAVASDGALWATTAEGLVRYSGSDWAVIAADVRQATADRESVVVAGPEGSAWASVDGEIVGFRPDGTRTPIGRPGAMDSAVPRAAGADGTVWTSEVGTSTLWRWDGSWSTVEPPGTDASVYDLVVTGDGALWARVQLPDGGLLGRYAEGAWTTFATGAGGLVAAPRGAVCVPINPRGGIDCYDADGLVATMPFDGDFVEFDIAPDGATWVNGQMIVRLAGTAPTG